MPNVAGKIRDRLNQFRLRLQKSIIIYWSDGLFWSTSLIGFLIVKYSGTCAAGLESTTKKIINYFSLVRPRLDWDRRQNDDKSGQAGLDQEKTVYSENLWAGRRRAGLAGAAHEGAAGERV